MLLWRSFWNLLYQIVPTVLSKLVAFLVSSTLLVLLRCFNSNIGVPASINLDNDDDTYCQVETFLKPIVEKKTDLVKICLILSDVVCTVIIEILVIICWFGTYEIIVHNLPSQPGVSQLLECLIPLLLGVLSGAVAFSVQLLSLVLVEGSKSGISKRRAAQFFIACLGKDIENLRNISK